MSEVLPFHDPDKALIARIEELMANPPEHSVVLDLTPGVCKHGIGNWRGLHNRAEKARAIQRYSEDMAKPGGWLLNGSTVVFTDRHLIGDGQNRFLACIRAGRPFRTHVIFGVPHEYFFSMDQGRVRTPADVLRIHGVPNSRPVALAVRWAELLETHTEKLARTSFTSPQILVLYQTKHSGVADFYVEARHIATHNRQPVGLVMALLYHFDKIDTAFAAEFSEAWEAGSYAPRFRAIGTMQAELLRLSNMASGRIHDVVRAAMIVNAWNATRRGVGTRPSVIRWERNMPFPVAE